MILVYLIGGYLLDTVKLYNEDDHIKQSYAIIIIEVSWNNWTHDQWYD